MAEITRRIGLSLGADICWPICFEEIMARLGPIRYKGDTVRLETERVSIEPFDLRQPVRYDVVIDRLTHWYHTSREWLKKAVIMDDVYLFNNPWAVQSMEKHSAYTAMMRLGLPVPDTWLVPPKAYDPSPDLAPTLERYARAFDLGKVGAALGYPMFMKPYDGGAWRGVSRIDDEARLRSAYDESGKLVMHLQKAVDPFDLFVRVIGLGPQVYPVRYDPAAPLHGRYTVDFDFLTGEEASILRDMVLTINTFFGWDFNSCEALRGEDGVLRPIDFANACPDSQVTSLHYHFPWLVKANVRWSVFCAVTDRRMGQTLDWRPYFDVADRDDLSYREKLAAYGAIARERLDSDRFFEFCAEHLGHLDEIALDFFASDRAREAVRLKVEALFPAHEVEQFTAHFWGLIQFWCKTERDRLGVGGPAG